MNPEPGRGPWEPGTPRRPRQKLLCDNCVKCHGETGMATRKKFYPRINGQHYNYMLRQFEWIVTANAATLNLRTWSVIKNF